MMILFLSRWYPYPTDNGSKLRIYNLLRLLSEHHTIDLISFTSEKISENRITPMQRLCRHVETVQYRPFQPSRLKAILGFLSPIPRSVLDTDNTEMHSVIYQKVKQNNYNLTIASEVDMAQYGLHLPMVKILEDIELTPLLDQAKTEKNPFKKVRHILMWKKWLRYISTNLREYNGCTVVSEPECLLVGSLLRKHKINTPVRIIPNGVDTSCYPHNYGKPVPGTIIFSGALTYSANYNAMAFFLGEVYPLIQAKYPNVKLTITGRLDNVPILKLPKRSGVVFTDYVEDVHPIIASCWVSIVPLQIGGGTRIKILEALALGTPVVSTTKGAEGLEITPGSDILIADSPTGFASAVLRLLEDPNLRQNLSQNGRRTVVKQYDWKIIGQSLNEFINLICKC